MEVYGTVATAVWLWDESEDEYVDFTLGAQRRGDPVIDCIGELEDYIYVGFTRRFDAVINWLQTSGSYGALKWEFNTSSGAWVEFVPIQPVLMKLDMDLEYTRWHIDHPAFASWDKWAHTVSNPHSNSPPDTTSRYWVRISSPISVTRVARWDALTVRPYATLATVEQVEAQLQIPNTHSTRGTNKYKDVERYIRAAEDGIFHITGHYFRPEFVEDEDVNFKPYGMKLRYQPILDVLSLSVFTGSGYDTKAQGRREDFHYDALTGMVYSSTVFLDIVAPILRRGYSERRNQGSFKRGVRVRYIHGRNAASDPFSAEVGRITVKKVALGVITDQHFAPLFPNSIDRVTLQQRVDLWSKEVEEFTDRYAKLYLV